MLSKQNIQISIGLIVMGLALLTLIMDYRRITEMLTAVRALQVTATVALLFGIKKSHPAHKAKFLLFWLGATSIFFTMLIYASLYYIDYSGIRFYVCEDLISIILPVLAAAGVGYMMNIIYKQYIELTQGTVEPLETKQPPPYDPSLHNLIVSLKA